MSENNAGDRHDSSVDDESGSGEGRSAESRNSSTAESACNSWKKKSKFELHAVTFTVYPIIHVYLHAAFIKKQEKCKGNIKDMILALKELDKRAEARYEVMEVKRMKMFLDAEEVRRKAYAEEEKKRQQEERQHEEQMQFMFLSFLQQMSGGRQGVLNPPVVSPPSPSFSMPHPSQGFTARTPMYPTPGPPFPRSPDDTYDTYDTQ